MATKIKEILTAQTFGDYCIVTVLLDNNEEAEIYVGGGVECYYDEKYNKYKAFVKKA